MATGESNFFSVLTFKKNSVALSLPPPLLGNNVSYLNKVQAPVRRLTAYNDAWGSHL